jgi:hypothetical protein
MSPSVSVLPRNFAVAESAEQFIFEAMTSTIQKLGRQVDLPIDVLGGGSYRSIHEKDAEIISPVLVFANAFLEHLGRHVANHWGPKAARTRHAVLEVVITNGPRTKRIKYNGPVDGLASIVSVAQKAFDEKGVKK